VSLDLVDFDLDGLGVAAGPKRKEKSSSSFCCNDLLLIFGIETGKEFDFVIKEREIDNVVLWCLYNSYLTSMVD
jgi:hypothetical protein